MEVGHPLTPPKKNNIFQYQTGFHFFLKFIYLFRDRERMHRRGGRAETEGERIPSRPHIQHGVQCRAQTHKSKDNDLSRKQVSHIQPTEPPRCPRIALLKTQCLSLILGYFLCFSCALCSQECFLWFGFLRKVLQFKGYIKSLTWVQVMISPFVSSSPVLGSVLGAWSLLRILCLPLSLPLPLSSSISLCLSKVNKCFKQF